MTVEERHGVSERWHSGTWTIPDPGPVTRLLAPNEPLCAMLTPYHALASEGVSRSYDATSLEDAARWWAAQLDALEQDSDLPGHPTTGPIAFLVMPYDGSDEDRIRLIVPSDLVAREVRPDGSILAWRTWVTPSVPNSEPIEREEPPKRPLGIRVLDDGVAAFRHRASAALGRLDTGGGHKIVVTREVTVQAEAPIDQRWILRELERTCPGLAIFCVDGLIGASPQVLLNRNRDMVRTQVLSGSAMTGDEEFPERLTDMLRPSSPVFARHKDSVESTVAALAPHALARPFPSGPHLRRLPGVTHMITDVVTSVGEGTDTLALLERLHPPVDAVGLPYAAAAKWLAENEGLNRGRFTAPVGWLDSTGNATFVVALRCGQLHDDRRTMTLFAEVAMIAGFSVDDAVALSAIKLAPMCDALGFQSA